MPLSKIRFIGTVVSLASLSACVEMLPRSEAKASGTKDFPEVLASSTTPGPIAGKPVAPVRRPSPSAVRKGTVILKDGERVEGQILVNKPGELVTISSSGGERTFLWERVDEVVLGP